MAIRKRDEENIQIAIVKYLKFKYSRALFTNTLGGIRTSFKQAVKAKQTGYLKGVSDLLILEPNKKYFGLFLEIKTDKGKLSPTQREFITKASKRNYKAIAGYGLNNCIDIIDRYFNNDQTL